MSGFRKLKSEFSLNDLIPFAGMIFSFAIALVLFGPLIAKWVLGGSILLFAVYLLVGYFRTRSSGYLVTALLNFVYGLFVWSIPIPMTEEIPLLTRLLLVFFLFLLPLMWYMFFTRRMQWRGRDVFELAALEVQELTSGYTSRPRPVGRLDYTEQELRVFANFLSRHLIALPYYESDRVILAPIKNSQEYPYLLGVALELDQMTWIAFDLDGDVSVHIAHKDYLAYRDELSFDALCESLGKLFMDFLELFQRGQQERVIERLNALRMGIFS
jgi:hypothetical protein